VDFPSHRVAAKTRMCSFIASDKNWAPGHCLRQQVRSMLPQSVDAFGRGFVYVKNKADALSDYAYSIAIENSQQDTYFTEKLVDCFTTGTVPIYWGTRKIGQYFDPDGVIHFDTVDEIPHILQSLSMEDYQNRMVSILENFEAAKRFFVPEEWGVRGSKYFSG
jgi:hypothetical protein